MHTLMMKYTVVLEIYALYKITPNFIRLNQIKFQTETTMYCDTGAMIRISPIPL